MKNALQQYRLENDNVVNFIQQCCVVNESESMLKTHLMKSYQRWCEESGFKAYVLQTSSSAMQYPRVASQRRSLSSLAWNQPSR
ncbi:primase-like DNA-binding domain-containing protein [Tumebacillus flagellatus]|uniref:primase-like DNA-binding domain-containing protein n=1 Tax=Tumebacillus flagellatus TaxID=1157490 RepID=UPI003B75C79F